MYIYIILILGFLINYPDYLVLIWFYTVLIRYTNIDSLILG